MLAALDQHMAVLPVLAPLLAAPLAFLVGRAKLAWAIAFAASAFSLWMSLRLLAEVQLNGDVNYQLGGWASPMGIGYHIDLMNAYVLVLVSGISTVALPYAAKSINVELYPE